MASRSIRYKSLSIRSPRFVGVGVGDDNDAAAFLQEAGIADYMQQRAIFELVSRLKGAGLWSKMKAIYPFVGGTASSHKWNLKDPQDTDAAFRLSFSGGWTHSATGADPNGTNAYANTFCVPSVDLPLADHHISVYNREDTSGASIKCEIGAIESGGAFKYLVIYSKFSSLTYMVSGDNIFPNFANTDSRGLYTIAKGADISLDGFKNATKSLTASQTSTTGGTRPAYSLYIGAANQDNGGTLWSDREVAFASVGNDLTDTDVTNLNTIVDLYQKRLDRAV
jgi:hypothetical protein